MMRAKLTTRRSALKSNVSDFPCRVAQAGDVWEGVVFRGGWVGEGGGRGFVGGSLLMISFRETQALEGEAAHAAPLELQGFTGPGINGTVPFGEVRFAGSLCLRDMFLSLSSSSMIWVRLRLVLCPGVLPHPGLRDLVGDGVWIGGDSGGSTDGVGLVGCESLGT